MFNRVLGAEDTAVTRAGEIYTFLELIVTWVEAHNKPTKKLNRW